MEKKDSINKLNYQIVTVKEKKLTPAQLIANNTEILSLIFGNIVDFKERKNVELSCRKFYEVCNHRTIRSYFPFEEINYSHFCTRHDEGNLRIDMYGQEMIINIPKEFSFNEINIDIFTKVFRKCLSKVNSLNIQNISLHHVDFFMSLNCFKKIENVNMEYETLVNGGDIIFSKCSTLNPVNLTISNVFLIEENIKNVGQYTLPESIKTIHLSSMSFEWLLKKMGSIKIGIFDNLIYNESLSCLMNEKNKLELYLKLITYFKNISYEVYNFETIPNNEIFNKILLKNNIASFVTITFNDNNIYERFSRLSKDERSREAEGYIQNLKNPTRRFLAQQGIYLNIKKLKILDIHEKRINCPFFPLEIKKMKEDISRMKYLSVFEIYLNLFDDPKDFEMLCGALGKIQTIRIGSCEKMNFSTLKLLSVYARNLKNISLIGVDNESITSSKILSLFKTLQSLEIMFYNSYDAELVFNDLIKFDNSDSSVTFKWPKIQYLNIICNRPSFDKKKLIDEVKRNTPRKPGQLLVRDIIYYDNPSYQILVRLSKKSHVFDSPLCNGRFVLQNL